MQVDASKILSAPARVIFAIVSDVANWPQIIRAVKDVEMLTTGPVRVGTRLREERILFGHDVVLEAEVVELKRPRELRLAIQHRGMTWEMGHRVDAIVSGGSRLTLIFRNRPEDELGSAIQPLLTPTMQITVSDELEQDLADIAAAVSARAPAR